ncbi:MAG: TatD family hydrolase [Planctomycetota bacterium]
MIDTHCHLTFPEFAGRVDAVLMAARAVGVHGAVTIATTTANALECVALADTHDGVYASAGVHPLYSDSPCNWEEMHRAALNPKCVAWGELGLDRHYAKPPLAMQRAVLDEQLSHIRRWTEDGLAKPVIVHCREAFADLLPILASSGLPHDRFVFHCFTGMSADARMVLDFGAWISFTGVVTYPSARDLREAARLVPLDRMMVETDAPFLSPQPVRGDWPNEPRHVVHIAHALAELRGVDPHELERTLDMNAERFFGVRWTP